MNSFEEENQMNADEQFCSNPHCATCNQLGQGNLVVLSKKFRRYKCKSCGKTFVERKGNAYYRLHKDEDEWTRVVTLLSWGCSRLWLGRAHGKGGTHKERRTLPKAAPAASVTATVRIASRPS